MLISKYNENEKILDISKLEKSINHKLPESYRKFLEKYNGGDTPYTNWSGKCKNEIRFFYGLDVEKKENDIFQCLEYVIVKDLIGKKYLPIAGNSFGDYFCIGLEDEKIYFSYHDKNRITLISESFEDFISKVKSKKIGHIDTIEERKACLFEHGHGEFFCQDLVDDWQKEIDRFSKYHQEEVIL